MNNTLAGKFIEQEALQLLRGRKQFTFVINPNWPPYYGLYNIQCPWHIHLYAYGVNRHFKFIHTVSYSKLTKRPHELLVHEVEFISSTDNTKITDLPQPKSIITREVFNIVEIFK